MVPAQEIMLNNSAIKNLIRENKTNQIVNIIQTHRQEGMQALEDQLVQLAQQ
jgi:twitching motility protein PilT